MVSTSRERAAPGRPSGLVRLLALAVSLLAALLLAEVALRIAVPAQKRHYVWPPRMVKVFHPDPARLPGISGEAHFTVDAQGIRGPEMGAEGYRVLAVGGSTTECIFLDDAKAWPAEVGKALPRTADGRAVWVGNVGKAGMYSRDHVLQMKYLPAELPKIDLVLLLVGVNDLTVALAEDPYVMPPPITDPEAERRQVRRAFSVAPGRLDEVVTVEMGAESTAFYKRTALYQLVKRARAAAESRAGARGLVQDETGQMYDAWRDHRRHASTFLTRAPDLTAPLAEYRRNLGFIADLAAARGITLVLMTQPTIWRADLPAEAAALLWLGGVGDFQADAGKPYYAVPVLAEVMRRFNDVLLDVCRERSLPCLDLAARIPRDTTMFYDDTHFTQAGSDAVAAAVAEHLGRLPPFAKP
jgi:lysophospholipase L1-like esterase